MPRLSRATAALLLMLMLAAVMDANAAPFTPTTTPDLNGVHAIVDLPAAQHMRNTGGMGRRGPGTGAGLCVPTSCEINCHWLHELSLNGFQKWFTTKPGGCSPPKLDATIRQFCSEKDIPVPLYIQHTGGDDSFLDACFKNGRGCCVTYAGSDDFYRGPIAHMVFLAHLDATTAAIIDNNRPGKWIWMSRADFLSRWRSNNGGWAVCFLAPPPPPYESAPNVQAGPGHSWEDLPPYEPDNTDVAEQTADTSGYAWKAYPEAADRQFLFDGGRLVGMHDKAGWHPSPDGKRYLVKPKGRAPVPVPGQLIEQAPPPREVTNFGILTDEVHQFKAYWVSGSRTTRHDAEAVLRGDTLTDDSGKFNLSVVGPAAFQAKFKADWSTVDTKFTARVNVTYFDPSDWQVGVFKLPLGVQLRTPAKNTPAGRIAAGPTLGIVPQDVYDLVKLLELLGLMDGPKPTPPTPVTPPPATPPADPAIPKPTDPTPPSTPKDVPALPLVIAGVLLLLLKGKKK